MWGRSASKRNIQSTKKILVHSKCDIIIDALQKIGFISKPPNKVIDLLNIPTTIVLNIKVNIKKPGKTQ